jgi:radical SAM superfamily enzyme YgiQ (UPF0313 family)
MTEAGEIGGAAAQPGHTGGNPLRILLVQPEGYEGGIGFRTVAMPEPLALEMLAACVPDHEVRILDMRIADDLDEAVAEFGPQLAAVTALTPEVYAAQAVLERIKALDASVFTVVGGHHATLLPEDFRLPQVDAIALGEGELVFPELVQTLAEGGDLSAVPNLIRRSGGGFVRNEASRQTLDMDALPLPRRDLVGRYRPEYFFLFDKPDSSVATGRGCPYRCNFCSVWRFYNGRTRQMSARRVVDEVRAIETDHITFVDDNFLMNARRESRIADLLRAEGVEKRYSMECRTDSIVRHPELVTRWSEIGLYAVLLGLEGASDRALENVNKKSTLETNNEALRILQDHGIIIWGAFLVDPDWTADDFKRLRDYVTERQITHTQFTVLTPLPGTPLYDEQRGRLLTRDYRCYDTLHSVLPTRLPREEFYRHFANLYRQTDLTPYWDLVSEGKLTVADCRRGKAMLDTMSRAELYWTGDPILGDRRQRVQA